MAKPTEQEISDKRDEAATASMNAPKYPGMSYADGVLDALEWVMGDYEEELDV